MAIATSRSRVHKDGDRSRRDPGRALLDGARAGVTDLIVLSPRLEQRHEGGARCTTSCSATSRNCSTFAKRPVRPRRWARAEGPHVRRLSKSSGRARNSRTAISFQAAARRARPSGQQRRCRRASSKRLKHDPERLGQKTASPARAAAWTRPKRCCRSSNRTPRPAANTCSCSADCSIRRQRGCGRWRRGNSSPRIPNSSSRISTTPSWRPHRPARRRDRRRERRRRRGLRRHAPGVRRRGAPARQLRDLLPDEVARRHRGQRGLSSCCGAAGRRIRR